MEIRALINLGPWKAIRWIEKSQSAQISFGLSLYASIELDARNGSISGHALYWKSSFFFSLPSFLFFRDCRTSKNGGLSGRVAIRNSKKRWMKARSPFTRAPDSMLRIVRIDPEIFQDLFLSRSHCHRYSAWTSLATQNVIRSNFLSSNVSQIAPRLRSKTYKKIWENYVLYIDSHYRIWYIDLYIDLIVFDCNNKYFY